MKTERKFNLATVAVVLGLLLFSSAAMGVGAYLFENPTTHKSYPNKTVAGYLGVESGGVVELQTGPLPTEGQVLVAGCGTDSATSTATTSCAKFKAGGGASLPTGTAGQVLGVGTITTAGTGVGTSWQAVNGSIVAGSNITISKGTATSTNSSATLADVPKIHAVGFVQGSGSLSGTTGYVPVKTAGGWGDSTIYAGSNYLYFYDTSVDQRADGGLSFGLTSASDNKFSFPIFSFNRSRGTLASPTALQAGDPLAYVSFYGNIGGRTSEDVRLYPSVKSLVGSNHIGKMCLEVSDGSATYPTVDVWCGDSEGLAVPVPITLSGLTSKTIGNVLYVTSTSGAIESKALTASDIGAEPTLPAGTAGQVLGVNTITVSTTTTGTTTATAIGTAYQPVNGSIAAGSNVVITKGTGTETFAAVDLKDNPKIHATGAPAPLSDEVPQPSGALPGQAGTGTGCSRDTHKHHVGNNYPAPRWVLRAGAGTGTGTGTSTGLGAGWEPFTHASTHQPGGDDAMTVDAPVSVGSLRTIGEGSLQACSGSDYRLSNARTPTAHASTHQPGGSDQMTVDAAAATGSLRTLGTGALQACPGNDSRLSNARTPTAHASTHQTGGSDEIPLVTQSVDGRMRHEDKLSLDMSSTTPTANYRPVADSSGELTEWVKAFKNYSSGSCDSNYSIAQSTWTTVASIPCTISGGGAWFITGLVQFVVTANDYVGIRFTLDSTDIALSDRLVRVIRDLSSYVYSSINTTAIIPISDSNSHTCNLQVLRQDVADTMTVNCSSDTNQFARISAIKLYK